MEGLPSHKQDVDYSLVLGQEEYCGVVDLWMNHIWAQNVRLLARIGACWMWGKRTGGRTETECPISAQA